MTTVWSPAYPSTVAQVTDEELDNLGTEVFNQLEEKLSAADPKQQH